MLYRHLDAADEMARQFAMYMRSSRGGGNFKAVKVFKSIIMDAKNAQRKLRSVQDEYVSDAGPF